MKSSETCRLHLLPHSHPGHPGNPNLYRRYVDHVYRYLLLRVGNVEEAQDLTAQTFLAALENLASYRGEGAAAAWLLGIARHKAADYFRHRQPTAPLEAATELPASFEEPLELVFRQLQVDQVAHALRVLAPERAEAVALRFFGGLSNAEIAQVMNRNEAAVKMLVHRGIQDLRVRLCATAEVEA